MSKRAEKSKVKVKSEALTEYLTLLQQVKNKALELGLDASLEHMVAMKLDEAYLWAVGFIVPETLEESTK